MLFSEVTFCCGMTPYLIWDHYLPDLHREDQQQRYRLDVNQDLSKFRSRNERAESNWELVSRNVPYGIFSATPKKRAKRQLNIVFVLPRERLIALSPVRIRHRKL